MTLRGFIPFCLVIFTGITLSAQRPVKVKATYTYHAHENETTADAERIAEMRAKVIAIEEEFGTVVSESSSGIMSTDFDENFFSSYSTTSIKGEWIKDEKDPKFSYSWDGRMPVVTCTVEGLVQKIQGVRTDFETKILKLSPDQRFESTEFLDGDEMYLFFRSPIGGYLNVFLLCPDDNTALCLLPYRDSDEGSFKIDADTDYYLFSKDRSTINPDMVDEYNLTTERQVEFNEIMIIFSPEQFNKIGLKVKKDELAAIKETSYEKFNSWLASLQTKYNNITTKHFPIKISKK